jgi:hypothetical protein
LQQGEPYPTTKQHSLGTQDSIPNRIRVVMGIAQLNRIAHNNFRH